MGIWTTTTSLYFLSKHHQHLLSAQANLQTTLRELYHHEELLYSCPPELITFLSTYTPTNPRKFWQFFDASNDMFRSMAADTLHIAQDIVHKDFTVLVEHPLKIEYKLLKNTVEKWLQPPGRQAGIGRYILPSYTCLDHICEKGEVRGTWLDNREFAEMVALAWEKAVERRIKQLGFLANVDVVSEWTEEQRSSLQWMQMMGKQAQTGTKRETVWLVRENEPIQNQTVEEQPEQEEEEEKADEEDLYAK